MAREYCSKCRRPKSNCICTFMVPTSNQIEVILLQHPNEVDHPKGSANILLNSLSNITCFVGENFDQHNDFLRYIDNPALTPALLYPEMPAVPIENGVKLACNALVVIDSTWKKSYKIFQLSQKLQQLNRITLPAGIESQYAIRQTKKQNALSTLEATCYALGLLEQSQDKYQALIKSFVNFNQYQLSFRKNY